MIDIWVMKDGLTGKPKALRAAASFKRDFDQNNLNEILAKLGDEARLCLSELNSSYLSFEKLSKDKAKEKVDNFVVNLCKIEGLEPGSFDFMLDIPLIKDKEISQEPAVKDQKEIDTSQKILQALRVSGKQPISHIQYIEPSREGINVDYNLLLTKLKKRTEETHDSVDSLSPSKTNTLSR